MSKRIAIWGASSTYGVGDQTLGGWVNRLRLHFDNQQADHYRVYNLGISGEPTTDLIERFEAEAKARNPEIIVFGLGINDSSYILAEKKTRTSLGDFEKNIEELIFKAKKFTDNIIFVGAQLVDEERTDPIPWNPVKSFFNEHIEIFEQKLKDIIQKHDLKYIDLHVEFKKNKDYKKELLFRDGLHPSEVGHQMICDLIKKEIEL